LRERVPLFSFDHPDDSSVVGLIPSHGIEEVVARFSAVVFERLAIDYVVRELLDELRLECAEQFGILALF